MKTADAIIHTVTAATFLSLVFTGMVQASPLTFSPNNGAVFSDANPNGNALILATAVKPKNTGVPSAGGALATQNQGAALQQAVLSQISNKINNEIFNCGNTCQPSGEFKVDNQSFLRYAVDPVTGAVSISYDTPGVGTTTIDLGVISRGTTAR